MVNGGRPTDSGEISTLSINADIRHSRHFRSDACPDPPEVSPTERVYVAATKASPATEEPVKRTATKAPASPAKAGAKRAAAKSANGSAAPQAGHQGHSRAAKADSPAEAIEDGASGGAPKKTRTATKAPAKAIRTSAPQRKPRRAPTARTPWRAPMSTTSPRTRRRAGH